jgi:hypothetical protein
MKRRLALLVSSLVLLVTAGCEAYKDPADVANAVTSAYSDITSVAAPALSAASSAFSAATSAVNDPNSQVGSFTLKTQVFTSYHAAAVARQAYYNFGRSGPEALAAAKALDLWYESPAYGKILIQGQLLPAEVTVKSDIDLKYDDISFNADFTEAVAKTIETWIVTDPSNKVYDGVSEVSVAHTVNLRRNPNLGPDTWVTYQIS